MSRPTQPLFRSLSVSEPETACVPLACPLGCISRVQRSRWRSRRKVLPRPKHLASSVISKRFLMATHLVSLSTSTRPAPRRRLQEDSACLKQVPTNAPVAQEGERTTSVDKPVCKTLDVVQLDRRLRAVKLEKGKVESASEAPPFDAPPASLVFPPAIAAPTAPGNASYAPIDLGPTVVGSDMGDIVCQSNRVVMAALGTLALPRTLYDEVAVLQKNLMFELMHLMVLPVKSMEVPISYDLIPFLAHIHLLIPKAMCKLKMQKQYDVKIPKSTAEAIKRRTLSTATASTSTASEAPSSASVSEAAVEGEEGQPQGRFEVGSAADGAVAPSASADAAHTDCASARCPVEPMRPPPRHFGRSSAERPRRPLGRGGAERPGAPLERLELDPGASDAAGIRGSGLYAHGGRPRPGTPSRSHSPQGGSSEIVDTSATPTSSSAVRAILAF